MISSYIRMERIQSIIPKLKYLTIFSLFLFYNLSIASERENMLYEFENFEYGIFSKNEHIIAYNKYMGLLRGDWRISKNLLENRIMQEDSRKLIGKYIRIEGNKIYFPDEFENLAYYPIKGNEFGYEIKEIKINMGSAQDFFGGMKKSPENYGFEHDKNIASTSIRMKSDSIAIAIIHITLSRIMIFVNYKELLLIKESQPMFKEFNQFEHIKISKELNKKDYDRYMSYLRGKWKITDNINESIDRKNPPTNVEKYNGSFVIIKEDRILFPDSFFEDNYFVTEFARSQKKKKKRGDKIDYIACIVGQTYEFFSDGGPNYDPGIAGLEEDVEVAEAQIKYIGDDYFHTKFFHLTPTKIKMQIWTRYFTLEKVE